MEDNKVIRLGAEDFDEAMDFLNLVFSQSSNPHDFEKLIPALYKPTEECMKYNYAIRRNGKIRSVVGLFPVELHMGPKLLKVGGIGGVATHLNERNSGMMRSVMEACINTMKQEGYHISCLGGQRQRYNYYGYEKSGSATRYTISTRNVKHYAKTKSLIELKFEMLLPTDFERISFAKKLYDREPAHITRVDDNYYNYLTNWNMQPWAIIDDKGIMIGYLVSDKLGKKINEIFTDDIELFDDALCAWALIHPEEYITVYIPFWSVKVLERISVFSESTAIGESYQWQIFKWTEVIEALLTLKAGYTLLANGEVKIGIEGYGIVKIIVNDGVIDCRLINEDADFTVDKYIASRIILGPLPVFVSSLVPFKLHPVLASWFPLPLCWFPQDNI